MSFYNVSLKGNGLQFGPCRGRAQDHLFAAGKSVIDLREEDCKMKDMKKINALFIFVALVIVSGCATPLTATSNKVESVEGRACFRNILGFIPLSLDASIYTAAKDAGINSISTVDEEFFYLGIYNQKCTIVHGAR